MAGPCKQAMRRDGLALPSPVAHGSILANRMASGCGPYLPTVDALF